MSDFARLTGRFRAQKTTHLSSVSKSTRKPRETTVCNQCRTSKLRCDRGRPACGNCVKKGDEETCHYNHSNGRETTSRPKTAGDRLANLEFLVKQLIQDETTGQPRSANKEDQLTPDRSPYHETVSEIEDFQSSREGYVGSTHWSAVLDEIDGLKVELCRPLDVEETLPHFLAEIPDVHHEPIFGNPQQYSLQQIITDRLPSKLEADRLLSTYFQGENFILPYIHAHHFQGQYSQFWSNPQNVDPLWLSILFSIFQMAHLVRVSMISNVSEGEVPINRTFFHVAAGQCLVVGDYHRPRKFVVEGLLAHAHCKSMLSLDPWRETGAILAMALRSAYHLGYHRDPDRFNKFTPFEAEMRRRTWAICKQLDLMTSFQLGLPSTIRHETCDTRTISNLSDSDFGPDSQVLPPSRSEHEATRLLWFVVKDRQMESFAKVCQDVLSFREKSESEILELDQEIRQTWMTTPSSLRVRPFSESIVDPPFVIITRLYLEFIYLKSLLVLHRKYMVRGDGFSTEVCLEAGKTLVSHFIDMYREFALGGRLHSERWMLGCYTMNDFLLGTTVLCLYLHGQSNQKNATSENGAIKVGEVRDLLQQACSICVEKSDASRDAHRVARVVKSTLDRVQLDKSMGYKPGTESQYSHPTFFTDQNRKEESFSESQDVGFSYPSDNMFELFEPFSFLRDGAEDIDWTMFDPSVP